MADPRESSNGDDGDPAASGAEVDDAGRDTDDGAGQDDDVDPGRDADDGAGQDEDVDPGGGVDGGSDDGGSVDGGSVDGGSDDGGSVDGGSGGDGEKRDRGADETDPTEDLSTEELRRQVEERYDFEDFGPAEMAEMDPREWDAVFDEDSWITGSALLDRVENELRSNIQRREVFAVAERVGEGDDDRLVAYSDEGYVIVRPDGSIQGTGTVMRDVEPMVALCAMESYDVPDVGADAGLPHPDAVAESSGDLGNKMMQVVAGATILSGVGFLVAWLGSVVGVVDLGFAGAIVLTLGVIFLVMGLFLFLVVANARLSDRMRSEQYRDRLRAVGAGSTERPAFLPDEAFEAGGRRLESAMAEIHREAVETTGDTREARSRTDGDARRSDDGATR